MSREIVEAVRELERDRNLEGGILVDALRDGLLAAYKKTPGSYRHATVEIIDDAGDFRVFGDPHAGGSGGAPARGGRSAPTTSFEKIEEETGEKQHTLVTDDDLEIDWDQSQKTRCAARTSRRRTSAASPRRLRSRSSSSGSARPSARSCTRSTSTASRSRHWHRPAGRRPQQHPRRPRPMLLPRSEQVDGERYEQGSRIKAVITEVGPGRRGRR